MATTTPDNIRTPDPGDPYNLVPDLQTLAGDTQDAFTLRANLYLGTAAERTAFTTASTGTNWQDTDGTQGKYVWTGSIWLLLGEKFYSGTAAQRTAFTTAPEGANWQDTDGSKSIYRRDGGAWIQASAGGDLAYVSGSTNVNAGVVFLAAAVSGLPENSVLEVVVPSIGVTGPVGTATAAVIRHTTNGSAVTAASPILNSKTFRSASHPSGGFVIGMPTLSGRLVVPASGQANFAVTVSNGTVYGPDLYSLWVKRIA